MHVFIVLIAQTTYSHIYYLHTHILPSIYLSGQITNQMLYIIAFSKFTVHYSQLSVYVTTAVVS